MSNPYLQVDHVSKRFPGVQALDDVSVTAYSGKALALLGINGAGKSTLMNVLAGEVVLDTGTITVNGKQVTIRNQKDAEKNGIVLIHQEAVMFENLTAAENVYITVLDQYKKGGLLGFKEMRANAQKYLDMVGCRVPAGEKLTEATVGDKQMVEIARALAMGAEIILFDEPTSSLTINEKEKLFEIIRDLKAQGKTVIYITHFMDEALEISDNVCVMRDGKVVGNCETKDVTIRDIVKMMVGHDVEAVYNDTAVEEDAEVVLEVKNITNAPRVYDVSMSVKKGEVYGIWGLLGSGRSELFRAILGLDKTDSGEVFVRRDGALKKISNRELLRNVGYVTENRHADGLFMQWPIWKNITMPSVDRFTKGLINEKEEHIFSAELVERLTVKTPDENVRVDTLSGGNQQKVIMARWIGKNPDIFFLDEPTRGVDVGAKTAIHQLVLDLAKAGKSVILISSEIEEILNLSDRIHVLSAGRTVGIVDKKGTTQDQLMLMCVNEKEAEASV